jgi:VIT1/CCC1 family predicted Fe2+/Mn2+ transporter
MYNEYQNKDSNKSSSIDENLRKAIVITTGSSLIGAIVFFVAYLYTKNLWMLGLGVTLAISGVIFMFLIRKVQAKFAEILNKDLNSNSNE